MGRTEELEAYLHKCVSIDPLQLQQEFAEVAAELAYWNAQYADALGRQLLAKIDREKLAGQLFFDKRQELHDKDDGRVTEAAIKAAIEIDSQYNVARSEEADAQAEAVRLKGVAEAVRTKRDMLVSLGAHVRAEMEGDPSIRSQHRNAHMTTIDLES